MDNAFGGLLDTVKSAVFGGLLQDDDKLLNTYVPPAVRQSLSPQDQQDLLSTIKSSTASTLLNKGTSQDRFDFVQKQAFNSIAAKQAAAQLADRTAAEGATNDYISQATQPTVNAQMALGATGSPAGPTQARADMIGQANPNAIDLGQARANAYMNMAQKYASHGNVELAEKYQKIAATFNPAFEYATTVTAAGADGKPIERVVGKDGRTKDVGMKAYERKDRDIGGQIQQYDPYTGQVAGSIDKTMTFADKTAQGQLGVAQGNLGVARDRLGFDRQKDAREQANGKAPVFNSEAGGFIVPPTAANPSGRLIPLAGLPAKAPTEFAGKSAGFGARAEESNKIITDLTGKFSPAAVNAKTSVEGMPVLGGLLAAGVSKGAMSPADQRAEQAQRDFVNAVLRQESGASIGANEFESAKRQYFPQPGDGAEVIAQKARNRDLAVQGFKINAGKAAFSAPSAPPSDVSDLLTKYKAK